MSHNKIICIDALSGLKKLAPESINLICTSPPYSDIRKSYPGPSPFNYVEWFTPIGEEMFRSLSSDGSFILNINDKCVNGERIPYAFELVIKLREIGFKLIDTIIWTKKNGISGSTRSKRAFDAFEYIFHFGKTINVVWNPDELRRPYSASSIKRSQKPIKVNASNREARGDKPATYKTWNLHPRGAYPINVISFKKDSGADHPAAYDISLPAYFIKGYSDKDAVVLDPFSGGGTTCAAVKKINEETGACRSYIGFEICEQYVKLSQEKYGL